MSGKGKKPPPASDRVGGPSTIRGINFQINFGILKALELIGLAKNQPHRRFLVTLEPRFAGSLLTTWDIRTSPPDVLTEAKLQPARSDLLEWLERVRATGDQGAFLLVCGKKRGQLMADLEAVARLAHEAAGSSATFRALVSEQDIGTYNDIVEVLGPEPDRLLRRIAVEEISEVALQRQLKVLARCLSGARADHLIEHLFKSFSEGGASRRTFDVHELIEEVERRGITLYAPPETNLQLEPLALVAALFVIQRCPAPIPLHVVAMAVEVDDAHLGELLAPLEENHVVFRADGHLAMVPRTTQIAVIGFADLAARALRFLLDWIKLRGDCVESRQQILNVIALAELCANPRPEAVVGVFGRVQSILKAMGDKRVVLQLADLCLQVANRMDQSEGAAQARALTLVCGRSWVYQRIGRLQEAMVSAQKSLDLGRSISWQRNTAYCMKCMGRLLRMQSDEATGEEERKDLLSQSVSMLNQAITMFETSEEHGPTDPDTGDSYSLLGRTHLTSGELHLAGDCIRKAFDILPEGNSKDYLDLKILAGDIELRMGNPEAAEVHYTDVLNQTIPDDHQRSEILARAHLQRGRARQSIGRTEGARSDYQKAQDKWLSLDEPKWAAEAEWRYILVTTSVPRDQVQMFEKERSVRIRVKAFRLHESGVAKKSVVANRAKPSQSQIDQLLRQAAKEVSLEHEW